jgi:hypothetical protein
MTMRNFICPESEERCCDRRCKKDYCYEEKRREVEEKGLESRIREKQIDEILEKIGPEILEKIGPEAKDWSDEQWNAFVKEAVKEAAKQQKQRRRS